jgi:hypothetical protein
MTGRTLLLCSSSLGLLSPGVERHRVGACSLRIQGRRICDAV